MNTYVIVQRTKMLVELLCGGASISDGSYTAAASVSRNGKMVAKNGFPARFGKSCGDVVGEDERGVSEAC